MQKVDWGKMSPGVEALAQFATAKDTDFPNTYSGQAWRAAYRLWLAIRDGKSEIPTDPFAYDKSWNWGGEMGGEDLGLSGFMAGWAMNAVRQMLKQSPIGNPAVVTIGKGCEPHPVIGPAEGEMQIAIGGKVQ